jgi:T5SS/PEP-CTERM-associated repeat protein
MNRSIAWLVLAGILALTVLPMGTTIALAAVISNWNTNSSGLFANAADWDNGVPGVSDTADFARGIGVSYTVTFAGLLGSEVSDRLRVGTNAVTFSPGAVQNDYTLENTTTAEIGRGILIGELPGDHAVLNTSLPNFSGVAATLGDVASSDGTLNVTGGTFHITGSSDSDVEFIVGRSGTGALNVSSGAAVNVTQYSVLGEYAGAQGAATITGTGSWTMGGPVYVGDAGTGTLNIIGGGRVSSTTGFIGSSAGSSGTVTVDGASSWWTSGQLLVGNSGTGTLNITGGGQVRSTDGYIAYGATTGAVTIAGAGSTWTNSFSLIVGDIGSGTLSITDGGHVNSPDGIVGNVSGSAGAVTIAGSGSTWTNSFALIVGDIGSGTLSITAGGQVNSNMPSFLGLSNGSTGTASVDGVGSKWANGSSLDVGRSGSGTLTVSNGGTVSVGGPLTVGGLGEIHGNGFITGNVQNGGLVSPGDSPGALHITGDYAQAAGGKLLIELAGTTPGSQYDQLLVTGKVTLDGTLQVLLNGFSPIPGNTFQILDFASLTGTFATMNLPTLSGGLTWNTSQLYVSGVLTVGVPGDYNHNGTVDAADYTVWRDTLGQTGAGLAADGNHDQLIDTADYNLWKANFGQAAGSGSHTTGSVPEPATAVMLSLGMLAIFGPRRIAVSLARSFLQTCQTTQW